MERKVRPLIEECLSKSPVSCEQAAQGLADLLERDIEAIYILLPILREFDGNVRFSYRVPTRNQIDLPPLDQDITDPETIKNYFLSTLQKLKNNYSKIEVFLTNDLGYEFEYRFVYDEESNTITFGKTNINTDSLDIRDTDHFISLHPEIEEEDIETVEIDEINRMEREQYDNLKHDEGNEMTVGNLFKVELVFSDNNCWLYRTRYYYSDPQRVEENFMYYKVLKPRFFN